MCISVYCIPRLIGCNNSHFIINVCVSRDGSVFAMCRVGPGCSGRQTGRNVSKKILISGRQFAVFLSMYNWPYLHTKSVKIYCSFTFLYENIKKWTVYSIGSCLVKAIISSCFISKISLFAGIGSLCRQHIHQDIIASSLSLRFWRHSTSISGRYRDIRNKIYSCGASGQDKYEYSWYKFKF
jgi:hypothetical protein